MLASWVSQASFDPPGLTVAVKEDRAVEGLLPVGNRFVLNVLAEGKDKAIMKAMLKGFGPGEDRFAGLQVESSEGTGAVIFPEAAAYLECTVAQRMRAGDHWLVYATVDNGRVLSEEAQSAVHFRSVGTTY
jgi:flavin reductase (DIM6/NTAB) family NADH-FMN oxidoreductase RutF